MAEVLDDEESAYDVRLQKRLLLLKSKIEEGGIRINSEDTLEGLKALRYAQDGKINLSTVNSHVRSLALAVGAAHHRDEIKASISLREIQETYFKFIEQNFGQFYKIMVERNLTPHEAGLAASESPASIDDLIKQIPQFLHTVEGFWNTCAEAAYAHIEDMCDSLKGVFGGDLFPAHNGNIASKYGIPAILN